MDIDPDSRMNITVTEIKVLEMLQQGLTNREIANALSRSKYTIKTHVEHILAKTGARNRAQISYMYRNVKPDSDHS